MANLSTLDFLVLGLAAYRLAYLITKEDAPYKLAARFRARFPLGGLTTCIYCASIWTAALCVALYATPAAPLVWIAAVSGVTLFLHRFTGGDY